MSFIDWSCFTKRINVNASPQDVYNAWCTSNNINSWFLRMSEFTDVNDTLRQCDETIQTGDQYKWRWFGYPDSITEEGQIIEANGNDKIKFTFGGPKENPMIVTVSVSSEQDETIVTLKQENIPLDDQSRLNFYMGCGEGWTFYLANLKSILEGGIDLRNKNESLQRMINS